MVLVARLDDGETHDATDLHAVTPTPIQGQGVTDQRDCWAGFSISSPVGSVETRASCAGKVHFVLAEHPAVTTAARNAELGPNEFSYLSPKPERSIKNRTNLRVQMQVIASN
ncbi:MAG: hypothetical protein F4Z55_00760 [Boseongicola sp. SB0667_bin_21]|nr:hypothetical protein [Boseongicola sp. SB0667_bin_21]